MTTAEEIERRLREALAPALLRLRDDSARHAGHAGATSGGGHYHVLVVSERFEGASLLERHRRVNELLRDLFGPRIHALGLTTLTPAEWAVRDPTAR